MLVLGQQNSSEQWFVVSVGLRRGGSIGQNTETLGSYVCCVPGASCWEIFK